MILSGTESHSSLNVAISVLPDWSHHLIIIKSFYSLWSVGHPWRASRHCGLQLSPWPSSTIFLWFLAHPLLSFTTFPSANLSFYIPEDFNVMQSSLFLLFLYVTCPIRFHFLLFIWLSIDFWWVTLHSSLFIILSVHFIFIVLLMHSFTNICSLLINWLVVFQVSQVYNNTDFTFVLNIHSLTSFDISIFLHTGYSWTNTPSAFLILLATSSSVPLLSDTTLPRYTKDPTSSISVSSNTNFCVLDVLTLKMFILFMLICNHTILLPILVSSAFLPYRKICHWSDRQELQLQVLTAGQWLCNS